MNATAQPVNARVFWCDLRLQNAAADLCANLPESYRARRLRHADDLSLHMKQSPAELICFDYDYPDLNGLKRLQDARRQYPSTPVIMLTEQHSEALAIWALRTRVWDYLVKPLPLQQLCSSIDSVFNFPRPEENNPAPPPWAHALPAPFLPEMRVGAAARPPAIAHAISYVENNYPAKIPLRTVARLCGLGPFQFSRTFKREQGISFREFLLQYRIHRAADLFKNPRASVTDVAFTVGFTDLSYFARIFRRYTGSRPSEFRLNQLPGGSNGKKQL
jgi:YesN/AraC family two-component response regulator